MNPIKIAAAVASTAISAFGQIQAGRAAAATGKVQQELAEREAMRKLLIGKRNAQEFEVASSAALATRNANFGGSGAEPTGSFTNVGNSIRNQQELQRLKILSGAEDEALKLRIQGSFAQQKGQSEKNKAFFSAASSGAQLIANKNVFG